MTSTTPTPTPTDPKPGIKTTEFWLALVAVALIQFGLRSDAEWAQIGSALGTALVAAGYGFARSNIKTS